MQDNNLDTAMLFAAGLGTRLQPFTNKHPKALAMVNGKTLLQRNVEYLQGFGIKNIVVNVHHFANQIIDIVNTNNGWGSNVFISNEEEEVLETGGGLNKAIPLFNNAENIVVMNVDILTTLNLHTMFQFHLQHNAAATLGVSNRVTSRYLIFENNTLCGWLNTNTNEIKGIANFDENKHQKMAFSGVHIINKNLLHQIALNGKFSMIDLYLSLITSNNIIAYNHSQDIFIDVGKPESILKAERTFA
jgi:N-acetyl-alpha-D-muramate 1-phosphate uridylyltransferase